MAYDLNATLTGAQAAAAVGVSRQLVRRWRILGHLQPMPHTSPPRYRLGDVLEAERRTRESPRSRRAA